MSSLWAHSVLYLSDKSKVDGQMLQVIHSMAHLSRAYVCNSQPSVFWTLSSPHSFKASPMENDGSNGLSSSEQVSHQLLSFSILARECGMDYSNYNSPC